MSELSREQVERLEAAWASGTFSATLAAMLAEARAEGATAVVRDVEAAIERAAVSYRPYVWPSDIRAVLARHTPSAAPGAPQAPRIVGDRGPTGSPRFVDMPPPAAPGAPS